MRVKRLNVGARTNRAQIHCNATGVRGKFFRGSHKFAAEALSLQRGLDTEKAEIHAVAALLEIDTTCERVGFFEKKKLTGAQVLQRAVAVDAIGTDERTLHFKCGVDEPCQRVDVGIFCNTNRKKFSSTNWFRKKSSGREILPRRRVLPQCAEADCIWRCDRCGKRSRF